MAGIAEAGITITTVTSAFGKDAFSGISALTTTFTYPKYGTHWNSCQPVYGSTFYSPGICPSGYQIKSVLEMVTTTVTGGPDDWSLWQGVCCPSGFSNIDASCASTFTTDQTVNQPVWSSVPIPYTSSGTLVTTTSTFKDYDATSNQTVLSYGTMYAQALGIYWQASDLAVFDPEYASALASRLKIPFSATAAATMTAETASPSSTSRVPSATRTPGYEAGTQNELGTQDDPGLEPKSSRGLSTGAKAGIAVGAVASLAIFIAIAFLLFARHRRRKPKLDQTPELDHTKADAPELVQLRSPGP